jgi:hypothetical protein
MEINHDTGKVTVTSLAGYSKLFGVLSFHDDRSTMHSTFAAGSKGTYSVHLYGTVANKWTAITGLKIRYNLNMSIDSANRVILTGKTTDYPAMELWEYSADGTKKLYSYSASGYGVFDGLKHHRSIDVEPSP